ncbi:MAG: hypothetical protein ACYC3G_00535 [Minisyncoccota bacterium]
MVYMYLAIGALLIAAAYDMGKDKGKKTWQGTVVHQSNATDGVYSVLETIERANKTIVLAERHDGTMISLILENHPHEKVFRIENGHMCSFPSKT